MKIIFKMHNTLLQVPKTCMNPYFSHIIIHFFNFKKFVSSFLSYLSSFYLSYIFFIYKIHNCFDETLYSKTFSSNFQCFSCWRHSLPGSWNSWWLSFYVVSLLNILICFYCQLIRPLTLIEIHYWCIFIFQAFTLYII